MRLPVTTGILAAALLGGGAPASAQSQGDTVKPEQPLAAPPPDIKSELPLVHYTLSAFGAPAHAIGGAGFGGVVGRTVDGTEPAGGGRIWASPFDRLTLLVQADRTYFHEAAPSALATVRLFGSREQGWAGGAMLAYKADGFAELGGEVEGAILLSLARKSVHLDTNVVVGGGFEEQEADAELKTRAGYDVTSFMRIGIDGRMRVRVAGDKKLPGDRLGDIVGGPELLFGYSRFFFAATGGPSTVGVATGVGWSTSLTLGAAAVL